MLAWVEEGGGRARQTEKCIEKLLYFYDLNCVTSLSLILFRFLLQRDHISKQNTQE
jgi:hypothetical protein